MLLYNVRIALKSLRRNPWLTALVVSAIALGIAISTTFIALRHLFEKDPLPGKSHIVFNVRMDNWDPARPHNSADPNSVPQMITYRDMRELMKSDIPTHQSASFISNMFVHPDPKVGRPFQTPVRLVFSGFFPMFDVPFKYGSGWDKAADAKPEQVIVIDSETNDKLFGGANSVGRLVRIDEREYRVVGVMDRWRPSVRFYDLTSNQLAPPEAIYMPFNFTVPMQIRTSGNSDGWKSFDNTIEAFLQSEQVWLTLYVELPTAEKQQAYRQFVDNYVREQKKIGRFQRPLNNRVKSLPDLMKEYQITPRQVTAMAAVSLLFLVVCSLNLVGLLLGKFLARIPEISVRRALGASRFQVFWQHIVECEVIGVIGGAIGLALSFGILKLISKVMPNGDFIALDMEMVLASIFLSLVAGLLAGVYPAWRVCTVPPAMQLKVQ
jgi:putative ABC transport system permease protein